MLGAATPADASLGIGGQVVGGKEARLSESMRLTPGVSASLESRPRDKPGLATVSCHENTALQRQQSNDCIGMLGQR